MLDIKYTNKAFVFSLLKALFGPVHMSRASPAFLLFHIKKDFVFM